MRYQGPIALCVVLPAALAGTMAAAPATAAAARPVTAVMTIVGRNDSGGGGIGPWTTSPGRSPSTTWARAPEPPLRDEAGQRAAPRLTEGGDAVKFEWEIVRGAVYRLTDGQRVRSTTPKSPR